MAKKLILTRGIPASGKSTFAKSWVSEDPTHRVRFNWDDLRNMMGPYWVPERENTGILKDLRSTFLLRMMEHQWDIVCDNMNLNPKEAEFFKREVDNFNSTYCWEGNANNKEPYEIEYKDFFTPVEECIRRDSMRPNPIGATVIRQTWNRYRTMICTLENQRVHDRVKQPKEGLKKAVVFDLDATLAFNLSGRPYWGEGCAEGIKNDVPNEPMLNMFKAYLTNPDYQVIVVTGREASQDIIAASKEWFTTRGINVDNVIWNFRPVGSRQKGQDYKLETLNEISKEYNIELVIDDSQKIVDCLRENGYTVLQPNEGKF